MAKPTYYELLRHPKWQEKRLRIMERDGFKCVECGDNGTTLNVHHGYYRKGADPWDYEDETLHTLCEPCHEKAEELRAELYLAIAVLSQPGVRKVLEAAKCDFSRPGKMPATEPNKLNDRFDEWESPEPTSAKELSPIELELLGLYALHPELISDANYVIAPVKIRSRLAKEIFMAYRRICRDSPAAGPTVAEVMPWIKSSAGKMMLQEIVTLCTQMERTVIGTPMERMNAVIKRLHSRKTTKEMLEACFG